MLLAGQLDDNDYLLELLQQTIDEEEAEKAALEANDRIAAAVARLPGAEVLADEALDVIAAEFQAIADRLVSLRIMLRTPQADQAGWVLEDLGWLSQMMDARGRSDIAKRARHVSCLMTSDTENQAPA